MTEPKNPLLSSFPEFKRDLAMQKFHTIKAFLEDGVPLTEVSLRLNTPLRTLRRRVKNYREHGLIGLIKHKQAEHSTRIITAELVAFAEGLALRSSGRTSSSIWREVCNLCKEKGWSSPSYATV